MQQRLVLHSQHLVVWYTKQQKGKVTHLEQYKYMYATCYKHGRHIANVPESRISVDLAFTWRDCVGLSRDGIGVHPGFFDIWDGVEAI